VWAWRGVGGGGDLAWRRGDLTRPKKQSTPPPPPPPPRQFAALADPTLAYSFTYPVASGGVSLTLVPSRRPERYSSAAPLSADARQRIVAELVDLKAAVTVSVTVGPPPPAGPLADAGTPPAAWPPRAVADAVLVDRSTARTTAGQRLALATVESVEAVPGFAGGEGVAWLYQHAAQGSPSSRTASKESYRRAWALTAVRKGKNGAPYLFTLNLACPQDLWPALGPAFKAAALSFALDAPTDAYVAPDQDPWRFF